MGGSQADTVTVEQAKDRLRVASENFGVAAYVRRRPYRALALGFAVGTALGTWPSLCDRSARLLSRSLFKFFI